jgi:hypothetical protein
MTAPGCARVYPLTMRWYLMVWRGGGRLLACPIRTHEDGRTRIIGAALTVLGFTVAAGKVGTAPGTFDMWFRDFGRRTGRWTIGGWRTLRRVPLSTGWVGCGSRRIGVTVTVASRTLCLARLANRAEVRHSRANFGDLHTKARNAR